MLWGGKGCDAAVDTIRTSPDCFSGHVFDPRSRGTDDRFLDHLYGGTGGTSAVSTGPKRHGRNRREVGPDILDWRPRGSYTPGTGCTTNPFPDTIGNPPATA